MPIYEFHCDDCGKDSEVLVRSSAWQGTPCPHCGSHKLDKKFSVFASSGAGEASGGACAMPGAQSGGGGGCGCCCSGGRHRH